MTILDRSRGRKQRASSGSAAAPARDTKTSQDKAADIDDLLDEIDKVLETNAQEFVESYLQKGGE